MFLNINSGNMGVPEPFHCTYREWIISVNILTIFLLKSVFSNLCVAMLILFMDAVKFLGKVNAMRL